MSALENPRYTPEQYLEWERAAPVKSEYFDGQIFAMAGASEEHVLIVTNLVRELSTQFKGKPCRTYSNDMRVKVSESGLYTYPDVVVVCGERQFSDAVQDTLENPTVIFEVLSPTTEAYDRGAKFAQFRRLPSLQEYVLVSQTEFLVEQFVRQSDGNWLLIESAGEAASVSLPTLSVTLPLSEIYDRVEFPPLVPIESDEGTISAS